MSDGAEKATVRVTIFGEEYAIRTDAPQEYTLECARYVDEAVQLAALQITDELFRTREDLARRTDSMQERLSALRERVDAVVQGDGGGLRTND